MFEILSLIGDRQNRWDPERIEDLFFADSILVEFAAAFSTGVNDNFEDFVLEHLLVQNRNLIEILERETGPGLQA